MPWYLCKLLRPLGHDSEYGFDVDVSPEHEKFSIEVREGFNLTEVRKGPLAGIQVIEFASFISGPFAAMMLADLGADVIKVEPPGGDPLRRFGRTERPLSPLFVNLNRDKRSVVLDLKLDEGKSQARRLLAKADLVICNWRPGIADRLGLGDDVLAECNERLIRIYVTGYGSSGPLANTRAFDSVLQARLGITDIQGDGEPTLTRSYLVDKLAALMVAQAALAALVSRERTGIAERVDVAMLDAAAYFNFPDVLANRTFLSEEPPEAKNLQIAAARPLRAQDGWIVIAPVTGDQVRRACAVVGRDELADQLFHISDAAQLTGKLFDEFEPLIAEQTVEDWNERFTAADVPVAPCLSIDGHLADPQVVFNDLYSEESWEGLGLVRNIRYPAIFSTWGQTRPQFGPPEKGRHNAELIATTSRLNEDT